MLTYRGLKKTVLVVGLAAVGCNIGSGNGSPFGINVPWFAQQTYYYCGPAAIQMWAVYDGSRVSQNTIASFVGAVAPAGTPAANVVPGVDQFTSTKDAFYEDAFSATRHLFSRCRSRRSTTVGRS